VLIFSYEKYTFSECLNYIELLGFPLNLGAKMASVTQKEITKQRSEVDNLKTKYLTKLDITSVLRLYKVFTFVFFVVFFNNNFYEVLRKNSYTKH
jgi:hypothetical protein